MKPRKSEFAKEALRARRIYRRNKWRDISADMKPGQVVRLHDITDVRSLCGALKRAGQRGSYQRDRHGFKVVML